jgi:hypothetical protein
MMAVANPRPQSAWRNRNPQLAAYLRLDQRQRCCSAWRSRRGLFPYLFVERFAVNGTRSHSRKIDQNRASSQTGSTATECFSFIICYLLSANGPHLAGKPRFFAYSENQVHCDDPVFTLEFSERNSGSPFLSEVGPRVRRLARLAKCSCKPNARKWRRRRDPVRSS